MLQNSVICMIAVASLTVVACTPTGTSDSAESVSTPETGTSAYYILTQTITDLETYQNEYVPQVLLFIAKYGGEIVVASFDDAEPLQGNPAKGVVVLRFPSEQVIRDFMNDPEYQPAKELRIAVTTNANAVLAPEFQMPEG